MVGYVSDDIYTLKIFSLSIFFWIDRLVTRHMIKKTVDKCDYLYVISEIQKIEYEKCFNKKCKILTKGAVFSKECPIKKTYNKPLKLVYTGNIGAGRWKTLGMITNVLKLINRSEIKAQLFIYTTTPMSKKMEDTLDLKDIVFLMGGVSFEKIPQIQDDSDILIHVESIGLKDRLGARHSFSTKLVDYFYRARCILAVGPPDVASIDYLIKNDAAIIANNPGEILQKLNELIDYPDKITEYAIKSWECGKRNHDIYNIQNNLHRDLQKLCNDNNKI
jgi:hypothetical protein